MIAWKYLDKKSAAVDVLKDYALMDHIIQSHPDKLDEAQARMTAAPSASLSGMPKARNPQSGETKLAAEIDEIDVLKERYRSALEYMDWFCPAWGALSEDEQYVLTEFYKDEDSKQTDSVGNICEYFNIERSSAYNKKNRALGKLAVLLYGK